VPQITKNSVSLAGEFAVLSRLALNGYDANMVLGHTKGVDILVSHPTNNAMYQLEVKTRLFDLKESDSGIHGRTLGSWVMNKKHEHTPVETLFYCFVAISKSNFQFRFFVVPGMLVARYVKKQHDHWLNEGRRLAKNVRDTDMRLFRLVLPYVSYKGKVELPLSVKYEDNWRFSM
jgi:hypothetical protein